MTGRVAFLARTELFAGVRPACLESVREQLTPVRLSPGEVLFEAGDAGDAVYLVEAGELSLRASGVEVLTRRPGECVGEFALIDDQPRSATAAAVTEVRALRWDREGFRRAMAADPDVARGIFRMLTGKLRQEVDGKVAAEIERARWRQDLARAREVQDGMLPHHPLVAGTLEVVGHCRPAAELGGDYHDYVRLDDGRVAVVVADVTGHAFYAGLFVAMAKSALHAQLRVDPSPAAVLGALRRTLSLSLNQFLLMTCCYAVLDPGGAELRYANAGHPYPYRVGPGGDSERLEALDPILGARDDSGTRFEERAVPWRAGDMLVFYTDGITEARAPDGEMFGHARLESCLATLVGRDASSVRAGVLDAVDRHLGGQPTGDDLTLVVARAADPRG